MADYGLMPWHTDRLTADEVRSVIRHQDERWKAIRDQQRQTVRRAGR